MTTLSRVALLALVAYLAGCGTLPRTPVPADVLAAATMPMTIPGMPQVRAWAGRIDPSMERDLDQSFDQESREDFPVGADGVVRYPHLALSGGGANGAFGAGFLSGWTATGSRPVFKIVTGVSTGALMAPFAFLGSKYDGALHEFYTTTSSRDIFERGSTLLRLLTQDSLASTRPLEALITAHVDAAFLRDIAAVHARGRRLYMGTVDLDAQRFVIWNMGQIAIRGGPEALDLFRKVMLASASIPIVFPPVFFEVEVNGRRYDEMHVDGAIGARVFLNGGVFDLSLLSTRGGRGAGREDIFIIHNGQLREVPNPTPRSLLAIASEVLEVSSRSGVVGDLFRIYAVAVRVQAGFQWVTVAEDVQLGGAADFDPVRMSTLYEIGYRAALEGPVWVTRPPGFTREDSP